MVRVLLIAIAFSLLGTITSPRAVAQGASPGAGRLALHQQLAQTEARRKNRIAGNMLLSAQEAGSFWPVYEEYRNAVVEVRRRQLDVIVEYADAYNRGEIPPNQARALLAEAMQLEAERSRLKRDYLRRVADVLGPTRQLRLYQIETRLDAEAQAGVLAQIPLAQ